LAGIFLGEAGEDSEGSVIKGRSDERRNLDFRFDCCLAGGRLVVD
jgi:hypothetical protein